MANRTRKPGISSGRRARKKSALKATRPGGARTLRGELVTTKFNSKAAGGELMHAVGKALRFIRKQRGLAQDRVGDSGNLSRIERGKNWVSPERLAQLAYDYEVPVWVIFAIAEGHHDPVGLITIYQKSKRKSATQELAPMLEAKLLQVFKNSNDDGRQAILTAVNLAEKYTKT
jgi:transcriptional regulator with XRE-family HTH domain